MQWQVIVTTVMEAATVPVMATVVDTAVVRASVSASVGSKKFAAFRRKPRLICGRPQEKHGLVQVISNAVVWCDNTAIRVHV